MRSTIEVLRDTGTEMVGFAADELELRYTDWVTQVRTELELVNPAFDAEIEDRDQPECELRERVVRLLDLLDSALAGLG